VTRAGEWCAGVVEEAGSLGFDACDGGLDVVDWNTRFAKNYTTWRPLLNSGT
jgi:hypothetical protein